MRILFLASAIIASNISFAQTQTKISGTVTAGKKNIEAASVLLLNVKEAALVKTVVSGNDGNFEISNVPQGAYLLKISAAGFKETVSDTLLLDASHTTLSGISIDLAPSVKTLQNISVQSKKPFIEQKVDRTVVNVDASISNVGATALEVL